MALPKPPRPLLKALPGDGTASKENYPAAHPGWQGLPRRGEYFCLPFPLPSPETLLEKRSSCHP